MALSLTKTPNSYSLSGNPVIFEITTTTSGKTFHKLHARVTYDGSVVGEDALPVVSGKAEFDISDYLKEDITGHYEIGSVHKEYSIIKTFSITYFETYDNDGQEHDSANSANFNVIQGKLDHISLLRLAKESKSYNSKYFDQTDLRAMTLRTEDKYIYKHEDDFIYIYGDSTKTYDISIKFTLKDGSTTSITDSIDPTVSGILLIPTGFNNYIYSKITDEEWKEDVFNYTLIIKVSGDDDDIINHTYYLLETGLDYRQFIFKNVLGVYETVYFYGLSEEESKYERSVSDINNSDIILSGSQKQSEKINSGWITKEKYLNLLSLLKSKDSNMIDDGIDLPVIVKTTKVRHNSDENLYSIDLDIEFAHTDTF